MRAWGEHTESYCSAVMSTPTADLLDDLCTRFILNVPAEELQ